MLEEFLKEYYLKIKLLKKTTQKEIWLVKNTLDGELCVAKIQEATNNQSQKQNHRNVLHEGKFLQATQGHIGIPFLHWAGKQDSPPLSLIIVQKLGDTLLDKFTNNGLFSIKTVCQLGIAMLKMIQGYHEKGYVHGNIKLNSFQFGVGDKNNQLYFNDLMYSHSFMKRGKTGRREIAKNKLPLHQFMSLDRMMGYESYRKDDIQSIILLLIFAIKGRLPWSQQISRNNSSSSLTELEYDSMIDHKDTSLSKELTREDTLKLIRVKEEKQKSDLFLQTLPAKIELMPLQQICSGIDVQFRNILIKCRRMEHQEKPDYNYFIRTFKKLLLKHHFQDDGLFDWVQRKNKRLELQKEHIKESVNLTFKNEEQTLKDCYLPYFQKIELL